MNLYYLVASSRRWFISWLCIVRVDVVPYGALLVSNYTLTVPDLCRGGIEFVFRAWLHSS